MEGHSVNDSKFKGSNTAAGWPPVGRRLATGGKWRKKISALTGPAVLDASFPVLGVDDPDGVVAVGVLDLEGEDALDLAHEGVAVRLQGFFNLFSTLGYLFSSSPTLEQNKLEHLSGSTNFFPNELIPNVKIPTYLVGFTK